MPDLKSLPEVKFNDFWTRKVRTFFRRIDFTGRGRVIMDDFLEISSSMISDFPKMIPECEDRMVKAVLDFWVTILTHHLPGTARISARLSEHEFIKSIKEFVNKPEFREKFFKMLVDPFFDAADMDRDGKITSMEFKNMMVALRAPSNSADTIFKSFDTRASGGKLDLATFQQAMIDFFFLEDMKTSKFKLMWGNLVSYKRPEDYPPCNCAPIWEGKMRNMFRRLDVSGGGTLKSDDFIEIGKNLAQRGHLSKPRTNILIKAMLDIWVKFFGIDKEGKIFHEINEKDFVHNLRGRINTDFRHEIDQLGWAFFKAVEVESNGWISLQEYRNLQEAWNVDRNEADGMFKTLDSDKDGKISSDEYLNGWCEYFLGEDQNSVYKTFFGPTIVRHMDHR